MVVTEYQTIQCDFRISVDMKPLVELEHSPWFKLFAFLYSTHIVGNYVHTLESQRRQTFMYGCQAMSVTLNLYLREFFVHIFQRHISMNIEMRLRNNGMGRVFGAVLVSKGREDSTQGTSKLQ